MIRVLIRNWWLLAIRGALALIFAGLAFGLRPLSQSFILRAIVHAGTVVAFALLVITAGICTIAAAIRGAGRDRFHLLLWDGVAICAVGVMILLVPRLDIAFLVQLLAGWAMLAGCLEFLAALRLRRHIADEWSLALAGAASFFFGAYFMGARLEGDTALFRWLGLYAVLSGVTILVLSLRLRSLGKESHALGEHAGSVR